MSEFWKTENLYDIEKDGVFYKKIDNELMVVRRISTDYYWKTCKHRDYDILNFKYQKYIDQKIPAEVSSLKVTEIECDGGEICNVILPNTIRSLGKILHYYSNIAFPDSIVDSYYSKVSNCNNIKIPNSVLTIGNISCCKLVTIPSSVESIENIYNSGVTILKMERTTPPILTKCEVMNDDDILFVPVGAIEAYKNDPQWGKFKNIREDASLGGGKTDQQPATPKETNKIEELEKRVAELEKIVAELQKKIK